MKRVLVLGCGDKKLFSGSVHLFRGLRQFTNGELVSATNADIRPEVHPDVCVNLDSPVWKEFDTGTFDIVIAEHIIEHVHERLDFLRECRRILVRDGILILEVPNWSHITAHATMEHRSTFARNSFDDSYVTRGQWQKIRLEYRWELPFTWHPHFWIRNELIGRTVDSMTSRISGLRFYLRGL